MITDLLYAMSDDMNISRYRNESDQSFVCRLCYSALGQWCLNAAQNKLGNEIGTTKHNQTIVLNELVARYEKLFPFVSDFFVNTGNPLVDISVFIRRVYEETGYLLTDESNHNMLANFGRSIRIGNKALFFGLSNETLEVNGLGVFSTQTSYEVSIKDFLIRDNLSCEDFFYAHFDPIDFNERDIDIQELEFFNPLTNSVPSKSWSRELVTDCSIARKFETGPYFRVMKMSDGIRFADELIEIQTDSFISFEYRRLYFVLKKHYGNPLSARILKIDEKYTKIHISGFLPNREYYFLLLLSWPERSAFDKVNFIIRNIFLKDVLSILENIGLKITGGYIYE